MPGRRLAVFLLAIAFLTTFAPTPIAFAADAAAPYKTQSDDTEFSETPYTEYGSFNDEAEEDADARFFQYGRFFGVSLGAGFQGVTGNRGRVWKGGFPLIDVKVHYWFDFNFALQMGFSTVSHQYEDANIRGLTDVTMTRLGVDLKYYFDTRNLAAAISFANPHIMLGIGRYAKTEYNDTTGIRDQDSAAGFNAGLGFEFMLKPRKSYVFVESKIHSVRFKDTYTTQLSGVPDLTGYFYTFVGGFMFTW